MKYILILTGLALLVLIVLKWDTIQATIFGVEYVDDTMLTNGASSPINVYSGATAHDGIELTEENDDVINEVPGRPGSSYSI